MSKPNMLLFAKGVAMGAADIVPGVSGGTIAFITGIYEELLLSLKNLPVGALHLLRHRSLSQCWQDINGSFLLTLFAGIIFSVFSLARLISYLLVAHPIPVWSFFFGLIIASVILVYRQIVEKTAAVYIFLVIGIVVAGYLTGMSPSAMEPSYVNFFLSGMLAICAMILPGISGSFILLILGMYPLVLGAVKQFDVAVLMVFAAGCLVGLVSIANVLSWALKRFHSVTLALLTGFMVGALNKVWPWKETLEYGMNSHGEKIALVQRNLFPADYEQLSHQSSELTLAIVLLIAGCSSVLLIEFFAQLMNKKRE